MTRPDQTSAQPHAAAQQQSSDATPKHRYTAELAGQIEQRWQELWRERGTFHAANPVGALAGDVPADKLFVQDMFPYPSGAGLHVGHPLGYIASDVYARFMRMQGRRVLHPFGFDAFGLPAEQYAIETGRHPAVTTAERGRPLRSIVIAPPGIGPQTKPRALAAALAAPRASA